MNLVLPILYTHMTQKKEGMWKQQTKIEGQNKNNNRRKANYINNYFIHNWERKTLIYTIDEKHLKHMKIG